MNKKDLDLLTPSEQLKTLVAEPTMSEKIKKAQILRIEKPEFQSSNMITLYYIISDIETTIEELSASSSAEDLELKEYLEEKLYWRKIAYLQEKQNFEKEHEEEIKVVKDENWECEKCLYDEKPPMDIDLPMEPQMPERPMPDPTMDLSMPKYEEEDFRIEKGFDCEEYLHDKEAPKLIKDDKEKNSFLNEDDKQNNNYNINKSNHNSKNLDNIKKGVCILVAGILAATILYNTSLQKRLDRNVSQNTTKIELASNIYNEQMRQQQKVLVKI